VTEHGLIEQIIKILELHNDRKYKYTLDDSVLYPDKHGAARKVPWSYHMVFEKLKLFSRKHSP
jgi:hypothetical protein